MMKDFLAIGNTGELYKNSCYSIIFVGLVLVLVVLSEVYSIPPPKFGDLGPREGTIIKTIALL